MRTCHRRTYFLYYFQSCYFRWIFSTFSPVLQLNEAVMKGAGLFITMSVIGVVILLAGCNFPVAEPTQGPQIMYTLAAQTLQARRNIAEGTPRPTMTYSGPLTTPAGKATVPLGLTQQTTPTSRPPDGIAPLPCDRAHFVADVTIPDDTPIQAGMVFVKTWRIVNGGSCTWIPGYALVFAGGHAFGAPAATPLSGEVPPGSEVDITLHLTAPTEPGIYQGDWKLRSAAGVYFGFGGDGSETIWTRIQVVK
jgi:hypothetical protein